MMRGFYCFLIWLLLLSVNAWATAPVFYSACPFGTGTLETGDGNITITSGVATLTVAQTGNIGAGVCIEYNSLECWIAPNRIGFDSGSNSTGMSPGVKITDATSSATGIIRYTETTSGNWTLGTAAGWIYFESTDGTFGNNNIINGTKPTSISNVATVDGTIQGNIGGGNTEFVVKSAIGGTPSNQTSTLVTSIHHEYASLSAFEAGFIDSSHINNTSLVAADVVAFACCYYDHGDQTTDAYAYISFGITGIDNYLQIYTPMGGAESINKQRHDGVWTTEKYYLTRSTSGSVITSTEDYIRMEGLQVTTGSGVTGDGITSNLSTTAEMQISNCIITDCTYGVFFRSDAGAFVTKLWNNVVYDCTRGIMLQGAGLTPSIYNCTVSGNSERGISEYTVTGEVIKNCAVFNNPASGDFYTTFTVIDYCASDDGDGTNAVDWTQEATDWTNVFKGYASGDFSLENFTGTGKIIDMGTDLSSSEGIWRDINGNERGASWDIGADEYVSAGASTAAQIIMIIQ